MGLVCLRILRNVKGWSANWTFAFCLVEVYYCGIGCQKKDISRHREEDGCGKRPQATGRSRRSGWAKVAKVMKLHRTYIGHI